MSCKSASLLGNGTLLIVSIALALLVAEGVARLATPAPPQLIEMPRDDDAQLRRGEENRTAFRLRRLGDSSRHIFVETPTGRRLRANAHLRIRHFLNRREIDFRTNSLGYRNREIAPKTLYRVLFLGDSITGGDYLEEEETFVRQVERLSWASDRPLETINAGVGAIGMMTELAILEETGLSTDPDAVVLGFYLNDFNESYGFSLGRLPGWLNESHLAWLVVRAWHVLDVEIQVRPAWGQRSLAHVREEIRNRYKPRPGDPQTDRGAFYQAVHAAALDWGSGWSQQLWESMEPLFLRFRQLAEQHDFEPLIVVFPVALQVSAEFVEDYPQRRVARIADGLDIPVLDLLPILRAQSGVETLFYDHCHYTPAGNRLVAEEILSFIHDHARVPRSEAADRIPRV